MGKWANGKQHAQPNDPAGPPRPQQKRSQLDGHRNGVDDFGHDLCGPPTAQARLWVDVDAVREHVRGQQFDVVGQDETSPAQGGPGLAGVVERHSAPRAGP